MANNEHMNNKLSIKNLLFTKAIPNYVIPFPINGHKIYSCQDCGDRYILQSSYEYHINRRSVFITYMCRYCNEQFVFFNRCKLLSHIRSHAFKTATINVSDLQVEPLPQAFFKNISKDTTSEQSKSQSQLLNSDTSLKRSNTMCCIECKKDISILGIQAKDRALHFMKFTDEVHTCPICLCALPTICGLKVHLRLHQKNPPYFCPECGMQLSFKSIYYPYNHNCESFNMMRATARYQCPVKKCTIFHPNEMDAHMKEKHLKKVYKCPSCVVACFSETTIENHLKGHIQQLQPSVFYQCEKCPGKLVLKHKIDNHLKIHKNIFVYPCWACGKIFKEVSDLLTHHNIEHNETVFDKSISHKNGIDRPMAKGPKGDSKKIMYRVVKRCDKCKRSFTYKCKYDQINILPNECPYKICSLDTSNETQTIPDDNEQITCHICKMKIPQNWEFIKKHYAKYHKEHRCIDARIIVSSLSVKKTTERGITKTTGIKKKRNRVLRLSKIRKVNRRKNIPEIKNLQRSLVSTSQPSVTGEFFCNKCGQNFENAQCLEEHLIENHRDPCMAYQCMECGECFVVKPSFSTHLLLEHNISDVEEYITKKQCYNENALTTKQCTDDESNLPLLENQCKICRLQFDVPEDLEKHFRVHGMAFLMKNNSNKNNP